MSSPASLESEWMRLALKLARKAEGRTSPNPMVGAVLVRDGKIIGSGWHRKAGQAHAEVSAIADARARGQAVDGATLFVTLEPCSTHGRTPPCTEAVAAAGIRKVVAAARDPNPRHRGRGFRLLRQRGIEVESGLLEAESNTLNEVFNHWIVRGLPFVTVKAAMTLDGKIATRAGESKWITGERARAEGMKLRRRADAILVGVNTVLADDPQLSLRPAMKGKTWRRIVLDTEGRIPFSARMFQDEERASVIVITAGMSKSKEARLRKLGVEVWRSQARPDPHWILKELGARQITHLLVEGGGEASASFFEAKLVQRVCFFYAPMVLADGQARKAVAGGGAAQWPEVAKLRDVIWRKLGPDLFLTARVD